MQPKQVYSAIINTNDPYAWVNQDAFGRDPILCKAVTDICRMRWTVLEHPLCAPFATALLAAGNSRHCTLSLCLGHMDEQALLAVACHLDRARAITGLTINDSLTVWRESLPFPASTLAQVASTAASSALGYTVTFTHLPCLRKPDAPPLSLQDIARRLGASAGDAELDDQDEPLPDQLPPDPALLAANPAFFFPALSSAAPSAGPSSAYDPSDDVNFDDNEEGVEAEVASLLASADRALASAPTPPPQSG